MIHVAIFNVIQTLSHSVKITVLVKSHYKNAGCPASMLCKTVRRIIFNYIIFISMFRISIDDKLLSHHDDKSFY